MLSKSQIIVLHTIKHGDNGLVLQCYSNTSGRTALYMKVSSKNKLVISNLHRLSILDVVTYNRGSSMPIVKEMEPLVRLDSVRTNIYKNTIAIFLSELLVRCIKESEANLQLYQFLTSSISILEHMQEGVSNFHIHFMVHLSKMLGFMPMDNYSASEPLFNISSARFCEGEVFFDGLYCRVKENATNCCFSKSESELLHLVMNTPAIRCCDIKCNGELRFSFSNQMIRYLSHHLGMNLEMKSHDVLHEVFN